MRCFKRNSFLLPGKHFWSVSFDADNNTCLSAAEFSIQCYDVNKNNNGRGICERLWTDWLDSYVETGPVTSLSYLYLYFNESLFSTWLCLKAQNICQNIYMKFNQQNNAKKWALRRAWLLLGISISAYRYMYPGDTEIFLSLTRWMTYWSHCVCK